MTSWISFPTNGVGNGFGSVKRSSGSLNQSGFKVQGSFKVWCSGFSDKEALDHVRSVIIVGFSLQETNPPTLYLIHPKKGKVKRENMNKSEKRKKGDKRKKGEK